MLTMDEIRVPSSLDMLPLLVLDEVLSYMDTPSLLALSSSCRWLHLQANRILYKNANTICYQAGYWPGRVSSPNRLSKLEEYLSLNPENAIHLRHYASFSMSLFKAIWGQVPLNLTQLCLKGLTLSVGVTALAIVGLCNTVGSYACGMLGTWYRKKYVLTGIYLLRTVVIALYLTLPKFLHQFPGLRKFTIYLWHGGDYIVPYVLPRIFESINCPTLEHLVIDASESLLEYPGANFPSLRYYEIIEFNDDWYFSDSALQLRTTFENVQTLRKLKDRRIYFRNSCR